MNTKYSKRFSHSRAGNVINFLLLVVIGVLMAFPMVFTISAAFKPLDELFLFPPSIFVRNPTFDSFRSLGSLMKDSWVPFSRYIFNSVLITAIGTFGHVIIASLAAFRLAKYDFPLKNTLSGMVVLSLMFSGTVTGIPSYIIMTRLGLLNTWGAIILPAFSSSLGLFLMKQFMEQMIPNALIEAAEIDGASGWTIFSKIVMPIVKPAWLTLIIFSFQGLWSNTGGTYLFDEQLKPLPYALQTISAGGIARTGTAAAVGLVMIIPPILVFIISQSNVIETMSTSGMKD